MHTVGHTTGLLLLLWTAVLVGAQEKPDSKPVVVRMSGAVREATTPQPISPLATRVVVVHNNMVPVPIECFAPPSSGACSKDMVRVYYDSDTRTCKPFSYTGCGGNANRFYSVKNCYRICHPYRYKIKPVVAKVIRHQPPTTVKPPAAPAPAPAPAPAAYATGSASASAGAPPPQPMSNAAAPAPAPSPPSPTPALTPSKSKSTCSDGRRSVNGRCPGKRSASLRKRRAKHRHRRRSGLGPNAKKRHHHHNKRRALLGPEGLPPVFSNEIGDYDDYLEPPPPPPPGPRGGPLLPPRGPRPFRRMGGPQGPPFRRGPRRPFYRGPRFRRRAPGYNNYF